MSRARLIALSALGVVTALSSLSLPAASAGPTAESSFFAHAGSEAATYQVPGDAVLVASFDALGSHFDRFHQVAGPHQAKVLGAEITVVTESSGERSLVAGSYFSGLRPSNGVAITPEQARASARSRVGGGSESSQLVLDPSTHRHLYEVETAGEDYRYFTYVDAQTGEVVDSYDALADDHGGPTAGCGESVLLPSFPTPCGLGVEYRYGATDDVKNLTGLTSRDDAGHFASSQDGRHHVYDKTLSSLARDDDDAWEIVGPNSPSQQATTDVIFYTDVTDDMLLESLAFDFVRSGQRPFRGVAHFSADGTPYANAFWNGTAAHFGDGDQATIRELTTLDIVSHEFTHGVTDFTSDLIYRDQSGALNESFSDILGNVAEHWAEPRSREPAASLAPDWFIGEDAILTPDAAPGFRNMQDPEEDMDPDHYTELQVGTTDNGFVHSNSGIPNHAFYLLAQGGQNASCVLAAHNSAHCTDADTQDNGVTVVGLGWETAVKVWFKGYAALSSRATMCDARRAMEAAASNFGAQAVASTRNAWLAVGLTDTACPTTRKGRGGGPKPK